MRFEPVACLKSTSGRLGSLLYFGALPIVKHDFDTFHITSGPYKQNTALSASIWLSTSASSFPPQRVNPPSSTPSVSFIKCTSWYDGGANISSAGPKNWRTRCIGGSGRSTSPTHQSVSNKLGGSFSSPAAAPVAVGSVSFFADEYADGRYTTPSPSSPFVSPSS